MKYSFEQDNLQNNIKYRRKFSESLMMTLGSKEYHSLRTHPQIKYNNGMTDIFYQRII